MSQIPEPPNAKASFDEWVRTVRDPAARNKEGVRVIRVKGAKAEYEIAAIANGRYALRTDIGYECGDGTSCSSPWSAFESREACIDEFLKRTRLHFEATLLGSCVSEGQQKARLAMLELLEPGLFGFVEPEVASKAIRATPFMDEYL